MAAPPPRKGAWAAQVVELVNREADIKAVDKRKVGALHYACGRGRLELVKFFHTKGIDLDTEDARACAPARVSSSEPPAAPAPQPASAIRPHFDSQLQPHTCCFAELTPHPATLTQNPRTWTLPSKAARSMWACRGQDSGALGCAGGSGAHGGVPAVQGRLPRCLRQQ